MCQILEYQNVEQQTLETQKLEFHKFGAPAIRNTRKIEYRKFRILALCNSCIQNTKTRNTKIKIHPKINTRTYNTWINTNSLEQTIVYRNLENLNFEYYSLKYPSLKYREFGIPEIETIRVLGYPYFRTFENRNWLGYKCICPQSALKN